MPDTLTVSDFLSPRFTANPLGITTLSSVQPRAARWAWRSMIPAGSYTLVAGAGGSSKTTLLLKLAADLSVGALPGCYEGEPAGSLIITQENDPAAVLAPNLLAMGADLARIHFGGDIDLTFDLDGVMNHCSANDIKLLIIDPIAAAFGGGIGSYQSSVNTLNRVLRRAAECDVAVVAVSHLAKFTKNLDVSRILGPTGLVSTARQVILVGGSGEHRIAAVTKSNVGATEHGWMFTSATMPVGTDLTTGGPVEGRTVELVRPATQVEIEAMMQAEQASDAATSDVRVQWLIVAVARNTVLDTRDAQQGMRDEFRISARSARNSIAYALGSGLVERRAEGQGTALRYVLRLTEAGQALITEAPETPEQESVTFTRHTAAEVAALT